MPGLTLPTKAPTTQRATKPQKPSVPLPATLPALPSDGTVAYYTSYGKRIQAQRSYQIQQRRRYEKQREEEELHEKRTRLRGNADYNDPLAMNSLTDALFNREAKAIRYGDWVKIPVLGDILSAVIGTLDVTFVQPIMSAIDGDWANLAMGLMTNLSETMDILANPVKSLIVPLVNTEESKKNSKWREMSVGERFVASFGFGKEGRVNFDYETAGTMASDIILETISDPINIIMAIVTFGSWAAGKAAIGSASKAAAKGATDLLETSLSKLGIQASQQLLDTLVDVAQEGGKKLAKTAIKQVVNLNKVGMSMGAELMKAGKKIGDTALRTQWDDVARDFGAILRKAGSSLSDDAVDRVNTLVGLARKALSDDKLTKGARKVLEGTYQHLTQFSKSANMSYGDLLRQLMGSSLKGTGLTGSSKKAVREINKGIKKTTKELAKEGVETTSEEGLKRLQLFQDQLRAILAKPENYKEATKYLTSLVGESADDILALADKVPLRHLLGGVVDTMDDSFNMRFMRAMEKIAKPTQAIDKAITRMAFLSNPATAVLYLGGKFGIMRPLSKALGHISGRWATNKLSRVSAFYRAMNIARQTVDAGLEMDNMTDMVRRIYQIATQDFAFSDLGPEFRAGIARESYDRTKAWLRGLAAPEAYADGQAVNLLADNDALIRNLRQMLPEEAASMDDAQLRTMFFQKFNDTGAIAAQSKGFTPLNIDDYLGDVEGFAKADDRVRQFLESVRNTDEYGAILNKTGERTALLVRLEQQYGGTPAAILRALDEVDPASASAQTVGARVTDLIKTVNGIRKGSMSRQEVIEGVQRTISFQEAFNSISDTTGIVMPDEATARAAYDTLTDFTSMKNALQQIEAIAEDKTMNSTQKALRSGALFDKAKASYQRMKANVLQVKHATESGNAFVEYVFCTTKQYNSLKAYLGKYFNLPRGEATLNVRMLEQLTSSGRHRTQAIMQSDLYRGLLDELRPDHEMRNALLNVRDVLYSMDTRVELGEVAPPKGASYREQADRITDILRIVESSDIYNAHLAAVEASALPPALKESYLNILHMAKFNDAVGLMDNMDLAVERFIMDVNNDLALYRMPHRYDLRYYATQMLGAKDITLSAAERQSLTRVVNGLGDAYDDVSVIDSMLRRQIIPEWSTPVLDEAGNILEGQFKNPGWNYLQHRQFVSVAVDSEGDFANRNLKDIVFRVNGQTHVVRGNSEQELLTNFFNELQKVSEVSFESAELVLAGFNANGNGLSLINRKAATILRTIGDTESDANLAFRKAYTWYLGNCGNSHLDVIAHLKAADGIPSVGDYALEVERLFREIVGQQARIQSPTTWVLDESCMHKLQSSLELWYRVKNFDGAAVNSLGEAERETYNAFYKQLADYFDDLCNKLRSMQAQATSAEFSYEAIMSRGGRGLVFQSELFNPETRAAMIDTGPVSAADYARNFELRVDPEECLQRTNGRWSYKGKLLPEDITDVRDAFSYALKNNWIEEGRYAPSYRALSPEQQFGTYPVIIEGKVVPEVLPGGSPVAVQSYIDPDAASKYFMIQEPESVGLLPEMTAYARQMAKRMNRANFDLLHQLYPDVIRNAARLYDDFIRVYGADNYLARLLRTDLSDEEKFVMISVIHDVAPNTIYNLTGNSTDYTMQNFRSFVKSRGATAEREAMGGAEVTTGTRGRLARYQGQIGHYLPDNFDQSFNSAVALGFSHDALMESPEVGYSRTAQEFASKLNSLNDPWARKADFLSKVEKWEKRGILPQVSEFYSAVREARKSGLSTLDALKVTLDKHKVYSAVLQRYGTLGAPMIEYFDHVSDFVQRIDEGDIAAYIEFQSEFVDTLDDLMVYNVFQMDYDELKSYVVHRCHGILVLPIDQYSAGGPGMMPSLRQGAKDFLQRFGDLNDNNFIVKRSNGNLVIAIKDYEQVLRAGGVPDWTPRPLDYEFAWNRVFGLTDTDINDAMTFRQIVDYNRTSNLSRRQRRIQRFVEKYREDLQKEFTHLSSVFSQMENVTRGLDNKWTSPIGSFGRTINEEQLVEMFNNLPKEVREAYFINGVGDFGSIIDESSCAYNFGILGRVSMRKDLDPFAPHNIGSVVSTSFNEMAMRTGTLAQYANYFGDQSPMNVNNLFKLIEDPDIAEAMTADGMNESTVLSALRMGTQNGDIVVADFGVDAKGIPRVREFHIETLDDLRVARANGMSVMPAQVYSSMAEVVNTYRWDRSRLYRFVHSLTYGMKVGMLILNPGFIFRNIIDSTLKNWIMFKKPGQVAEYYIQAIDYYRRYNETIDILYALAQSSGKPFDIRVLMNLFDEESRNIAGLAADGITALQKLPMTMDEFWLIHNFISNGPSAGNVQRISKAQLVNALAEQGKKMSFTQRIYEALMMPTKQFEQIFRLSEYLKFINDGMTNTEVFKIVADTHFDYAAKSGVARLLELFIPFYSFQAKNFVFWTKQLEKNPLLMHTLMNIMAPVWNLDSLDYSQMEWNTSQINRIFQGNLLLNDKGLTLKINPSFMDVVQLLYNPTSITSRLAPWAQSLESIFRGEEYNLYSNLGTTLGGALQAIPVPGVPVAGAAITAASQIGARYKSAVRAYQRTGNIAPLLLPSIFGSTYIPAKFPSNTRTANKYGQASYYNRRAYMDPSFRIPRRVRIYDKLYTRTGKNRWQLRFRPVDAFTVQWRIRESIRRD